MDSKSHRVLLGTNSELRKHCCKLVTKIRVLYDEPQRLPGSARWRPLEISHLTSKPWAQLQELDLTDGCMESWETAKLSCGAWPLLKSLKLARGRLSRPSWDENVFRQFKGKWPLLESLRIVYNKVDIAQVKALTEIEWPRLKTLSIEPDNDAMQVLMQGNWPQLRDLSLASGYGLQHLSTCRWSTLERLQLLYFGMSPMTMRSMVEAQLPLLKELSLVNAAYDDAESHVEWFTALAQGRWPLLSTLELRMVQGGPGCVETLASANWPCLQTVILAECGITDADVPALVAAAWPSVKNLSMSGYLESCFKNTQMLTLCMNKWPLLESLTVGAGEDVIANLSDSARSNWPMLKVHEYEYRFAKDWPNHVFYPFS